ncbi:hypothetical protein [Micromonospora sp. MH99]|uniref:hypothetical protein n=1 Tax=Micromonospora sp. MH99 TaxID=1945510 RepID=UPI001F33DE6B|nr:hypothetical protein [Micromonospora sp. MH99]MCF0093924.1 hypothetical protein [Micromonospora sp. MH99]
MVKLRASAARWHSDDFPGWVEISVRDALGQDHRVIEKVPVVTTLDVRADSSFPIGFWIEAEIESVDGGSMVVALPCGMATTEGRRSLSVVPADIDQARYRHDRQWLDYAVHELPAGVLYGPDGATSGQCAEMLVALNEFAGVCARLWLDDHAEFIEACRWHFDHYPHYLGRRRHFRDYATYIRDRHGPLRIPSPACPDWLRIR